MIESLPTIVDDILLELVLIKINSSMDKVTGECPVKVLEWVPKTHAKLLEKFRKATKDYFSSIGEENYYKLALAVKEWNSMNKESQVLSPSLK